MRRLTHAVDFSELPSGELTDTDTRELTRTQRSLQILKLKARASRHFTRISIFPCWKSRILWNHFVAGEVHHRTIQKPQWPRACCPLSLLAHTACAFLTCESSWSTIVQGFRFSGKGTPISRNTSWDLLCVKPRMFSQVQVVSLTPIPVSRHYWGHPGRSDA